MLLVIPSLAKAVDSKLSAFVPEDAVAVIQVGDPVKLNQKVEKLLSGLDVPNPDMTITGLMAESNLGSRGKNLVDTDMGFMVAVTMEQPEKAGFGAMPSPKLTLLYHARKGLEKAPEGRRGSIKSLKLIDGVLIASESADWKRPESESPLLGMLMSGDASAVLNFQKVWSSVGPMAEMVTGMMISMHDQKQGKTDRQGPALAPLWSTLKDIKTIQLAARIDGDDLDVMSRFDTVEPVTDKPDGSGMRLLASHLKNGSMMMAADLRTINWLIEVATDVMDLMIASGTVDEDTSSLIEATKSYIEGSLLVDRMGGAMMVDMTASTPRSVAIQGTSNVAEYMKIQKAGMDAVAKYPEFMSMDPIKDLPNAWTMKLGPIGKKFMGTTSDEMYFRLEVVNDRMVAQINGPLDWNPVTSEQSNPLTSMFESNMENPPAMAMFINVTSILKSEMQERNEMKMWESMGLDDKPTHISMTMTPHDQHWDMKANVNLKNMFAAIAAPFTAGMQAAMELASKQEEQRKAAKDKGAGGADKK
tara:strand:+ start:470 stop:2059 length:1590 start_codon:yes stop_codon:yes gene_type:complete